MNVIVIGGTGGIGSAIIETVRAEYPAANLFATWNSAPPSDASSVDGVQWAQVDLTSESSIEAYAVQFDSVHWLINAAGVLHSHDSNGNAQMPEKSLRQIDPEYFMHNVAINTLPTLLLAKHFEKTFKHSELVQFATVSAKVGSIEDNRLGGWHSYRCSKAALNMALKNISIEWRRRLPNVCVTALHPGTTDTALSSPFQANVAAGKLFTSEYTATCLVQLLASFTAADSGKFIAFNGEELPW